MLQSFHYNHSPGKKQLNPGVTITTALSVSDKIFMFIEFYPHHSILTWLVSVKFYLKKNVFGDKCSNIQYDENIERVISVIRYTVPLINNLFLLQKRSNDMEIFQQYFIEPR